MALPNETLALVYEDHLIRQHWPPLNKAQKKQALKFGLYTYKNGRGELKCVVQRVIGDGALIRFGSYLAGQRWLAALQDQAAHEEITLSEALERFQEQQAMKFLVDLSPEQERFLLKTGASREFIQMRIFCITNNG